MVKVLRIVGTFVIWVSAAVILAFVDIRLGLVVIPTACFSTVLLWGRGRRISSETPESQSRE